VSPCPSETYILDAERTQRELRLIRNRPPMRAHSQEQQPPHAANPASGVRPWDRSDLIVILPILLVSALLRLLNLDYMEFKGDEANNLFAASYLALGKGFLLVGIPSSIGTFFPPLFTYLMAVPLLFSRNPVVATGLVALLNCAAVGLSYVFCRRYFGQRVAVIAAVFFAVNPWAVLYSRKIWPPDPLPLFVVGFFYCLFAVVCEGRRRLLLGCLACFAAMTQLHLSSIYLLVVLVLVLVWFRPKIGWGCYLGGIGIALLIDTPYLAFDLLNRGYNLKIYLRALSLPSRFHPEALTTPFVLGSTLGFMHFVDWPSLDVLQAFLVAMGVVYLFFRRSDPRYAVLILWFCVPLVFLLVSKLDVQPHYFIFFYPIQFVLVGILADALMRNLQPRSKVLSYGTAALLVVLATYQLQSSVKFVTSITEREQLAWAEYGPEYGPPFRFRVQEIRELAQKGIVEPEKVQKKLLEGKPPGATFKYDFPATQYIVENLDALP
jgi:4-amino-4-deoxy-L-arabinose transferase-like glycosyltransferase